MFGHYLQVVLGMRLCFPMFMAISSEKTSAGWMTQHLILVCIFCFILLLPPVCFFLLVIKAEHLSDSKQSTLRATTTHITVYTVPQ
jgi:hypothetical protein